MIKIDLYSSKYEGESEIFLRESTGELKTELHLFSADFSSIMDWLPFGNTSSNESVIYKFNMMLDLGDC